MRALGLVSAAALCIFVAAGCGGSADESTAEPMPTAAETATPVREQAPPIAGTSVDGEPVSLADFRGQAVLINVWSSW